MCILDYKYCGRYFHWFAIFIVDHQRTFVTVHLIGQFVPNILLMWFTYSVLLMFIPIMGRVGDVTLPDLVVGLVSVFGVIVLLMWQVGHSCSGDVASIYPTAN